MNKKFYVLVLIFLTMVGVSLFLYTHHHKSISPFQLEVVKVDSSGYGYKILQRNKLFIYQPFVPAIGHKQAFRSKEDAYKVGQLMVNRMEAGEYFSISKKDIHQLHLTGYQE
ncbi:DUF4907 domain-containing protein [uncultured Bacteroides sp.]|uniref:DUF4907 domain-containing protein n=1 Tax=uncultured Bacteroides sp. TaxID=162156 RepID=UPI002AA85A0A|nr:DUF4907 domain-containing protein [uncultured Bacteroides sp.]